MYFDTHAHLNDAGFDEDREKTLERCLQQRVSWIVEIADAPVDWEKAIALSEKHPDRIFCALGLHPYHADAWSPQLAEDLKSKAHLKEVVAAGEIGLDYAKCPLPAQLQKTSFEKMLAAAAAAELPVVLHCREAYKDMLPIIKTFYRGVPTRGRFRGVAHCFSGSLQDAMDMIALNFALGVDGPVTYPKNDALRQTLHAVGLEHLVLETDSPYLPPQSSRGKRNEPSSVVEIGEELARIFSITKENIAEKTSENAMALFRLEGLISARSNRKTNLEG